MSDEECKVLWIFIIPLTWFAVFGIGWCVGNDNKGDIGGIKV